MHIGVCYAEADRQVWMRLEVPENSLVEEAIRQSGILKRFPEIDLAKHKVGIFGKLVKLDSPVKDGDRIEIYRPITADPKTVKRRRTGSDDDDD
ncbi:RnfH family protein [Methylocaldum sp.]|uniref:RnfH family protein n=1 Tax=Methylocaldum sp. TaxID=1969727 RepID=UPI002D3FF505|nr:RnfH family protein [Methylocaldum sp.]HYE37559.1 RnfH family protein [Methylocaldum sp.]